MLQVDFSENATIASRDTISTLVQWSGNPFHSNAWIKEDENESFVLVSDDITHTKYSVYIFMEYIMKHLR